MDYSSVLPISVSIIPAQKTKGTILLTEVMLAL